MFSTITDAYEHFESLHGGEIEAKRPKPIYRPAPGISSEELSGRASA